MSRSKVTPAARLVLFDFHVWIAKSDKLNFASFFGEYSRLLRLSRGPLRLIVSSKGFPPILQAPRRRPCYILSRGHYS